MVDGLWAGGNRSDTDFAALVYQIKLLGFNAVRLPFTFTDLRHRGRRQTQTCADDARPAWARRASDPEVTPAPDFESAPTPSLEVPLADWEKAICNSYIPKNTTTHTGERLLWTVQYLVASGLYVVVSGAGWVRRLRGGPPSQREPAVRPQKGLAPRSEAAPGGGLSRRRPGVPEPSTSMSHRPFSALPSPLTAGLPPLPR
jgi:hypothetical protein